MKEEFFCEERFDCSNFWKRGERNNSESFTSVDYTNVFSEDIGRIIYSSAFRRMQNKTQVHPLPTSDYLRNRLTHSIEVANIGKLIANAVANHLKSKQFLPDNVEVQSFVDIVNAACLAHDIGNPPFGHTGEEAIRSWFVNNDDLPIVQRAYKDEKDAKNDFTLYDGNAQGFRVLTRNQGWRGSGGLQLSCAVLGAFSKYPFSSSVAQKLLSKKLLDHPKYGYFAEDKKYAESIYTKLGMRKKKDGSYARHPLAFIVEAADDIAYLTTDLQDGHKHGSIAFDDVVEHFMGCSAEFHRKRLGDIAIELVDDRIQYLRMAVVSTLADDVYNTYVNPDNVTGLCRGNFTSSLLNIGNYKEKIKEIRKDCKGKLYYTLEKMEIESGGHYVIENLLTEYMAMANEVYEIKNIEGISRRSKNLFYMLPFEMRRQNFQNDSAYTLVCKIIDYISGMTDTFAIDQHRKITGNKLRI